MVHPLPRLMGEMFWIKPIKRFIIPYFTTGHKAFFALKNRANSPSKGLTGEGFSIILTVTTESIR
jgi:hypothetical protein